MAPAPFFTMVCFNSLVLFFLVALVILWRRPGAWLYLLMTLAGAHVGMNTLHSDEPIAAAFLLLALSAFAGFAQPRRSWLLAILLAVWVPLFEILAMWAGVMSPSWSGALAPCVAFIPALVGAGVGATLNVAAGRPTNLFGGQ
jgi:hypothetical protein